MFRLFQLVNKGDFSHWAVVTRFKNDNPLLEAFIRYYSSEWGIKRFYIGVGRSKGYNSEITKRINAIKKECNASIMTYIHSTTDVFDKKVVKSEKSDFFSWVESQLPRSVKRIINIDSDEFLYAKNINSFSNASSAHFHYIEIVPDGETRDFSKPFEWSVQAWYPRIKFFLDSNEKELKEFAFPEEQSVVDSIKKRSPLAGLPLYHLWCKKFNFTISKALRNGFSHAGSGPVCKALDETQLLEDRVRLLHENYFCYHVAVPDYDYFLRLKPKWQLPDGRIRMQAGAVPQGSNGLREYYLRWYANTNLPTFIDNRLQSFFIHT